MNNFVVNSLGDAAMPPAGTVTLRSTIIALNTKPATDTNTITFVNGGNPLLGSIVLGSALPDIDKNVTIQGPVAGVLAVARDTSKPQFSIFTIPQGITTTINDLSVQFGSNNAGGGIYDSGNLTLYRVDLSANQAMSGGGLFVSFTGQATLNSDEIRSNIASMSGGGIMNLGSLSVMNSNIAFNSAGASGGGIYTDGGMTLGNVTINDNGAGGLGGGVYNKNALSWDGGSLDRNTCAVGGAGLCQDSTSNITWTSTPSLSQETRHRRTRARGLPRKRVWVPSR